MIYLEFAGVFALWLLWELFQLTVGAAILNGVGALCAAAYKSVRASFKRRRVQARRRLVMKRRLSRAFVPAPSAATASLNAATPSHPIRQRLPK